VLRNFQLQFTPQAFHAEAEAWRAVIHLNLLRSVTLILNLLVGDRTHADGQQTPPVVLDDELRRLRMRLLPLRSVEEALARFLSGEDLIAGRGRQGVLERTLEVPVRSGSMWKTIFSRQSSEHGTQQHAELDNARRVIEACREDMVALWANATVHAHLREQSVSFEFQSGL